MPWERQVYTTLLMQHLENLKKQQEADKLAQALKDQKDKDETERQRLADNYDKNLKSAQQASDEDKRKALEDMEKKKADELAKALKNQETLNVWKAYQQATENSGDYEPVCFIKRNNQKPLVVVDAEYFVRLHNELVD